MQQVSDEKDNGLQRQTLEAEAEAEAEADHLPPPHLALHSSMAYIPAASTNQNDHVHTPTIKLIKICTIYYSHN